MMDQLNKYNQFQCRYLEIFKSIIIKFEQNRYEMQKLKNGQKKSAFLLKTYDILQNPEYQDVVCWHSDGVGFVINNIEKFTENVLPLYFKHSNFASFIRQLNMYGFSKKRSSKSENYYHHTKFQRNQKDLIRQIQRKMQKKSNKNDQKNSEEHEEVKISSQLSIQLQSRYEVSKKKQHDTSEGIIQDKIISLLNFNQELMNLQKNSLIEILKDLHSLKGDGVSQQEKGQVQNVFALYLEAQFGYFNQIKQRTTAQFKLVSHSKLQTEESLKDKRQGETREKIGQKNPILTQNTKILEQM